MTSAQPVPFLKGHGTENDFVIIPDFEDLVTLSGEAVARLCDRRAGIGGDGLLRVVRSAAHPEAQPMAEAAEWFMDYRNADGSVAEMCGNGVRVFVRYLERAGLVEPGDLAVATRAGVRGVHLAKEGGEITVSMGSALLPGEPEKPEPEVRPTPAWAEQADGPSGANGERGQHGARHQHRESPEGPQSAVTVTAAGRSWTARPVNMGNPHAVAFVDDLQQAGALLEPPLVEPASAFPDGVNVEFVADRGPRHVALRVHERGSGETNSCGTGACAVMVAAARRDGLNPRSDGEPVTYTVDVPGGRLTVTEGTDGGVEMTGPAWIVAEGTVDPVWLWSF